MVKNILTIAGIAFATSALNPVHAFTCPTSKKLLVNVFTSPQLLLRKSKEGLAAYRLKKNFSSFDLEAYRTALQKAERNELKLTETQSLEERAAFYVQQMNRVNPKSAVADDVVEGDVLVRKWNAFKNFEKGKEKGMSEASADRMASILMMPTKPTSLTLMDAFSKTKIDLKMSPALKEQFYRDVAAQGLKNSLEKEGVLLTNTQIENVSKRLSSNEGRALIGASMDALLAKTGGVFPIGQNWIHFSKKEISDALTYGVDAIFPAVEKRLRGKMTQNLIYNLSTKAVVALSVPAMSLIVAAEIRINREQNLQAMKDETKRTEERLQRSDAEKNFEIWEMSERRRLNLSPDQELDSNSESYKQAHDVFFIKK